MTKEEFLALCEDDRLAWLEQQTADGKSIEEICEELGLTRAMLQVHGFTFALGEWHMLRMSDRSATMGTQATRPSSVK